MSEAAAKQLQAAVRGMHTRREAQRIRRAVLGLQAARRGSQARTRARWWRVELRRLHAARHRRLKWAALRSTTLALLPAQTHAALAQLHVHRFRIECGGQLQRRRERRADARRIQDV